MAVLLRPLILICKRKSKKAGLCGIAEYLIFILETCEHETLARMLMNCIETLAWWVVMENVKHLHKSLFPHLPL